VYPPRPLFFLPLFTNVVEEKFYELRVDTILRSLLIAWLRNAFRNV
jgi:hypothetical protein